MESARILVAMSNDTSISKLRTILVESGYTIVDQSKDGHSALRKMRALKPDIAILDYDIPLMNGHEIAKVAIEDKICDVIIIATEEQKNLLDNMKVEYGFICMTKPLNKVALINTIDLMVKNRRYVVGLEQEIESLKATLDTRKEVERAKGLLMKHLNLSEAEAFKRIQKQSMDRGIAMKEIAKAIILAYDI